MKKLFLHIIYATLTLTGIATLSTNCAQRPNSLTLQALDADAAEDRNGSIRSSGGLWIAVTNEKTKQLESYFLPEPVMLFLAQYNTRLGITWKNCRDAQTDKEQPPVQCDELPLASGSGCSLKTVQLFCDLINDATSEDQLVNLQETEDLFAFVYQESAGAPHCPLIKRILAKIIEQYKAIFNEIFELQVFDGEDLIDKEPNKLAFYLLSFMLDSHRNSPLDITNNQVMGNSSSMWPEFNHMIRNFPNQLLFGILQEQSRIPAARLPNARRSGDSCFSPEGNWLIVRENHGCSLQHCSKVTTHIDLPDVIVPQGPEDRYHDLSPYTFLDISNNERWLCWVNENDRQAFYLLDLQQSINPHDAYRFNVGPNLTINSLKIYNNEELCIELVNNVATKECLYFSMEELARNHLLTNDLGTLQHARKNANDEQQENHWWKQKSVILNSPSVTDSAQSHNKTIAIWTIHGDLIFYEIAKDLKGLTLRQLLILQAFMNSCYHPHFTTQHPLRKQAIQELQLFFSNLPDHKPMFLGMPEKSFSERCYAYFKIQPIATSDKEKLSQEHAQHLQDLNSLKPPHQFHIPKPAWTKSFWKKSWVRRTAGIVIFVTGLYGAYKLNRYFKTKRLMKLA